MKRSRINEIIQSADEFFRSCGFYLPPFAYWSPEDWRNKGIEVNEIAAHGLGWDITDFGSGNFEECGLLLFTIRNGDPAEPQRKPYAEKIMISEEGQVTPMHFHWSKTEDIINRGGATLVLELYQAADDETLDTMTKVVVSIDGEQRIFEPGSLVELVPGQSITLTPRLYHSFWGKGGRVLIGEVSAVNDDHQDNRFLHSQGRFPTIEEDAPARFLMVGDYARYYRNRAKIQIEHQAD